MSHTEREGKASSHREYYHIGERAISLIQKSFRGVWPPFFFLLDVERFIDW